MTSQKLMISLSTIPNESKLYLPKQSMSYSSTDIRLPFKQTLPLKFPKKQIRKQTQMNMLIQSNPNPEKSSIRNFQDANRSKVFDQPERTRRIMKQGFFHSLSKQTLPTMPLNRSIEDIGAPNNRKKFVQARHLKPDPITIGQHYAQQNSALQKVWGQPRRHRDHGKECQQSMTWKTQKQSGYLNRYKQKGVNSYTMTRNSKYSIIS